MRIFKFTIAFLGVFFTAALFADPAHAQTLGGVIGNVFNNGVFDVFIKRLLIGVSYLFGIFLGFQAILKLKDHVESPGQTPIWDPIKRFLGGSMFLGIPYLISAVQGTLDPAGATASLTGTGGGYNTTGVSGTGLDAMLVNLMRDIWGNTHLLLLGFCYIAGIVLLLIGISRMIKSEQDGARGPTGLGTMMTFLVAGVLLSIDGIMTAANNTLFGGGGVLSFGTLTYTGGMSGAEIGHAESVIGAIIAFVAILGVISFIRGFFIMRGVSEGNSQASMMAAVTHILGGALAINMGAIITATQNSLGIANFGLTF